MISSPISEAKFQKKVLADLKELESCYVLKTSERARRGVPDLLICLKGEFIAIELKREGAKPDPLQLHVLKKIAAAHGTSFVAYPSSWDSCFQILKQK